MEHWEIVELPNGITCIHKPVRSAVAYCGLTINTGSRDELVSEHGLAHFIEHSFFKGTKRRRAFHINNRLENLGGELNAFTTKEETVVHATTLRGDFSKAAEVIVDVVFNSTFPQRELDKEKEIIIDEINSYKDSPAERVFDDYEDLLFKDSSLGHNILGSKKSLMRYTTADIFAFTRRTHNTNKMVFSSVGNFNGKRFRDICERYFKDIPANPRAFERDSVPDYQYFEKTVNKNTYQAHCILGTRAYSNRDERRVELSLLLNMLGGPSANSMLNIALRERNGLTYNVEAGYSAFSDTGMASIYFTTDPENLDRCRELTAKELKKIITEGITPRRLTVAKKQFIGQLAIAMESNEGLMLGAGKSFLTYREVDTMAGMVKRIDRSTPEEINRVAEEIFQNNLSVLIHR
jgi:predicted Zn-dependent peptidase